MKRRIRRTCKIIGPWRAGLSIAAGALLTVLISWLLLLFPATFGLNNKPIPEIRTFGRIELARTEQDLLHGTISEGPGLALVTVMWLGSPELGETLQKILEGRTLENDLPAWCSEDWAAYTETTPDPSIFVSAETAAGWPAYALSGRYRLSNQNRFEWDHSVVIPQGLASAIGVDPGSALPTRPLFPGFIINTVLYAIPVYALVSIPVCISGIRRRLTNRCTTCGYSLDNLTADTCPECGAPSRAGTLAR